MELKLNENIRAYRKQRGLTQEQLSEVLGVTVGAVHKWEAGLCVPELNLIVEMADFFDVSVDALLGYRLSDKRLSAMRERLNELMRKMDRQALSEAEKALKKYPHSFELVYRCAGIYEVFGFVEKDDSLVRRSLELLEKAQELLSQNTDPHITENTIGGNMAFAYFKLNEREKALELLKKNNVCGMYSDQIGALLAVMLKRSGEAEPYLSDALLNGSAMLYTAVFGFVFVYDARGEYESAREIISWANRWMRELRHSGSTDFLDKLFAIAAALTAYTEMKTGRKDDALQSMLEAKACAGRFDSAPDYSISSIRYAIGTEQSFAYDILGKTAAESIENVLGLLTDKAGLKLWKEINEDE